MRSDHAFQDLLLLDSTLRAFLDISYVQRSHIAPYKCCHTTTTRALMPPNNESSDVPVGKYFREVSIMTQET
jgi:hypothetical protein